MSRQHLTGTQYWCSACKVEGITKAKFCDTQGDPKENDFYITNAGRVDNLCKRHRLLSNAKYRPPNKGKRLKKDNSKKDHRQTYAEIGRSKLSDIDRGHIEGFKKYWSERQEYFKDEYKVEYSDAAVEETFRGMGL